MPLYKENSNLYEVIKVSTISGQPIDATIVAPTASGALVDIGATASGNLKVSIEETKADIPVVGSAYRVAATITRPSNATPYTAGDVIGDTGGSAIITLSGAGPSGGYVLVQSIRLLIGDTVVPAGMGAFRLHFYNDTPGAMADNAPFDLASGDVGKYAGYVDLPAPQDLGSTIYTQTDYAGTLIKLSSGNTSLYAELETRNAFTPASGTVYNLRVMTVEAGA
jgi:hypothetical protein